MHRIVPAKRCFGGSPSLSQSVRDLFEDVGGWVSRRRQGSALTVSKGTCFYFCPGSERGFYIGVSDEDASVAWSGTVNFRAHKHGKVHYCICHNA